MSNLSANTLFHFTKKQYLLKIIGSSFLPRYSKEFDPKLNDDYLIGSHVYIPMVSFCDIPMSMVGYHTRVYNSYGIGLKKSWGIDKRLNPVFYVQRNSVILENLVSAIHDYTLHALKFELGKLSIETGQALESLLDIYSYLKPNICGGKYRGKYKNYSYYNEKEWRYIPSVPNNSIELRRLFGDLSEQEIEDFNTRISIYPLSYKPHDINYIIIKRQNEIDEVLQVARVSNNFTTSEIEYLRTTFILENRILEDF